MKEIFFITGGTGFIGKRVIAEILRRGYSTYVLARENSHKKLLSYLERKKVKFKPSQLIFVEGDLSHAELIKDKNLEADIINRANFIIHAGAIYDLTVSRSLSKVVNVDGTRLLLLLASSFKNLKKFCFISTIAVSGDYRGIFYEEMLDVGQGFTDHYARTKFLSEKLVREWAERIPVTIVRPGAVIGETETGETEKFDGPYFILKLLYRFKYIHPFTPGKDQVYLEVVPVDFLAKLIVEITLDEKTTNKTYCAIDPQPLTLSEFIDKVFERMNIYKPLYKFSLKPFLPIFKAPVLGATLKYGGKILGYPAEGIFYIGREVFHDMSNTKNFCEKKGIEMVKFLDCFDVILDFFEKSYLK